MGKRHIKEHYSSTRNVPRGRTFTGCWNCRSRKVKCDEARPECNPCRKRGIRCSGYQSKLVWVTSDQKSYKPMGRRFLPCESTWDQTHIMKSSELDYFISICDAAQHVKGFTVEWPESKIPFGAFPSGQLQIPALPSHFPLTRSLAYGTPLEDEEALLFQHYVNHVAFMMMPYIDNRNPWRSSYPTVALYYMSRNQKSLYQALLAQAAFNLANLDCGRARMLNLAARYYTSAMEELRNNIVEQQQDYGTFVASIMTLMFVEIYSGNSSSWRAHFDGAWKFLGGQQYLEPWNTSAFAESSTQSLCLIRIISETSKPHQQSETDSSEDILLSSVSVAKSFGFTIGAVGLLMTCIADITRISHQLKNDKTLVIDVIANGLFARLEHCRKIIVDEGAERSDNPYSGSSETSRHRAMALYHQNAFISATYIYLYESLFDLPPSHVRPYVIEVFHNVQAFFAIDDGNFSLWPAFIAAVAAYESADVTTARIWLETASKVGMGNRLKVKKLLEEVWRLRTVTAEETGQDPGSINIDWREVMANLRLDILLV